ncbi:metallophosphoesterase [Parahaliea mediterranea]|uniref:Metallophosphoesterase n=1 Tax=Parahaliea mediterranea TaxID=651086 RepID=A0A939ILM3_9GAMM|nr:metallophosphoesterase [Parahaliea mediterranea]MBN7796128.1 metallophosphoesterase [Parahaliea mediterranea]
MPSLQALGSAVAAALLCGSLAASPVQAGDDAFTIAVIPDTQNYLDYTHQTAEGFPFDANAMFIEQMRYIADNLESEGGDIAFVTSLGDVWQHQTEKMDPEHRARGFEAVPNPLFDGHFAPTEKTRTVEMPKAHEGFSLIAGKVPFSVVPGNHDYDAMWTDAGHPPAAEFNPRDWSSLGVLHPGGLDNFRSVFGAETAFFKGKPWYVASHDGGADSAQVFTAGGYRFLHIGLQFDPPNDSLAWAARVIARYPGLPTIVSTHDYLNTQGERKANALIDGHKVDPVHNNPQMLWDKFLSRHDQIFLVLCGHQHAQAARVDDNAAGNPVWQLLSDYQDRHQTLVDVGYEMGDMPVGVGDGWFRMLEFDMSGDEPRVHVRTYSTHYDVRSSDLAEYADWYREKEKPGESVEEFLAGDDFVITLEGFTARFGAGTPEKVAAAATAP